MVTLFLMGEKGLSALKAILPFKSLIRQVVGAQDKNVQTDYYDEIRVLCDTEHIEWHDRCEHINPNSEYSVAIAWRWMINTESKGKLIVLHDSLLPKYRGFAPLVNMLINREPYIGVTALYGNSEFDKGDIIVQKRLPVTYPVRIQDAIESVSKLYSEIIYHIFEAINSGKSIPSSSQDERAATYSLWRDEMDYKIDWIKDAEYIQQFVYSLGFPFKGAYTTVDRQKFRVLDCKVVEDVIIENRCPGKVLFVRDECPIVVCGKGMLQITKLMSDDGRDCLPLKKYRTRFE